MGHINILLYKLKFDLKAQARYRFAILSDIGILVVLFIFFLMSNTGTSFQSEYGGDYRSLLLIGYLVWTMAISAISTLANSINFEARNGTLQNIINSVYPVEWTLFTQFVSSQVINLAVIFALVIVSRAAFNIHLSLKLEMLIPILFCILGMFGLGLIIAGVSMVVKKVSSLIFFIQLFLLFITDTIPTNETLLMFTRYIPLTLTNIILRKIISDQPYQKDLVLLMIVSVITLVVGVVVFRFFKNKARDKNILLLY